MWLSVWSEMQTCIWPSWCHCHSLSCFSKIQIGFTFLVPAHLGSPGQRAIKRACVCVSVTELLDSAVCNLLVLTAKSTVFLQKLFLAASQEKVADTASDLQKTDWAILCTVNTALSSCTSPARSTQYLTTIVRLSYDNAKVTMDVRQTSSFHNILQQTQGFSYWYDSLEIS